MDVFNICYSDEFEMVWFAMAVPEPLFFEGDLENGRFVARWRKETPALSTPISDNGTPAKRERDQGRLLAAFFGSRQ
jgi:hypothetical protein